MCSTKQPKAKEVKEKEPQYLRNPWLDSLSMTHSGTVGRNALRVDGARAPAGTYTPPTTALPPPTGPYFPSMGGGGSGGNPNRIRGNGQPIQMR